MGQPEHNTAPTIINGRINGRFAPGVSGNPGGSPEATRRLVNKAFLEALAKDFREGGPQAIAKVRKHQPAAYMKICALLVPREMQVEHKSNLKSMSDEQLEATIEAIQAMLAAQASEAAKVIEGTIEPAALPAPNGPLPEAALGATPDPSASARPNRLMTEAAAAGPRERKARKGRVPSTLRV
jgi:hypothetical protein